MSEYQVMNPAVVETHLEYNSVHLCLIVHESLQCVEACRKKKNTTLYMHIFTEYHIHSDKSVRGASQHGCHCSIRQISLYHMYGVLEARILL